MKLKKLLETFDFDDLFPEIAKMYPNAKHHRKEFQEAFEIMVGMRITASKQRINYTLIESPNTGDFYYGANDSNFSSTWDVLLGKEIARSKGVDLTDEEIAANCLINAIFIGKHPNAFDNAYNILVRS